MTRLWQKSCMPEVCKDFEDLVFHVNKEEFELYDQGFPAKQKEVIDTQLFKEN